MNAIKKIIVAILTLEARLILAKYKPFMIAVTGSVGKTSTKDAIYSVVKNTGGYVRKSEKSLNSEFGLPLTIIGVPTAWRSLSGWMHNISVGLGLILKRKEYPNTLVLEVGADHPGDILRVVRWLRPNISVITRVSDVPVHVEFFSSPRQVFEEKAALARGIRKGGTVILYGDDPKLLGLKEELAQKGIAVNTFGLGGSNDISGAEYKTGLNIPGFTFEITNIGKVTVKHVIGQPFMFSLLAAASVGQVLNLPNDKIVVGLNKYEPPHGRMNIIPGKNGSVLIDDTYNSSPDAVEAALKTVMSLGAESGGRTIAILGDMMELGKYSAEQHKQIGTIAAQAKLDLLVTVGQRAKGIAEEALKQGMNEKAVMMFDSSVEAVEKIPRLIQDKDIVLIKGSQSVRLERVVKALMAEPEKAAELLVRQEKEWLDKA